MSGFLATQIHPTMLPSLQELNLDMYANWYEGLDQILDVLEGLPLLTALTLSKAPRSIHQLDHFEQTSSKMVHLPRMQFVDLTDFCVLLVRHLVLPDDTEVSLLCSDGLIPAQTIQAQCEEMCSVMESHFTQFSDTNLTPVLHLHLIQHPTIGIGLKGCANCHIHPQKVTPRYIMRILPWVELEETRLATIIVRLCKAIPTHNVRKLTFRRDEGEFTLDEWRELLQRVPLLEELEIEGKASLLTMLVLLNESARTPQPLLSSLKRLALRHMSRCDDHAESLLNKLVIALVSRKGQGLMLQELEIDLDGISPVVPDDDLALLIGLVSQVTIHRDAKVKVEQHECAENQSNGDPEVQDEPDLSEVIYLIENERIESLVNAQVSSGRYM